MTERLLIIDLFMYRRMTGKWGLCDTKSMEIQLDVQAEIVLTVQNKQKNRAELICIS